MPDTCRLENASVNVKDVDNFVHRVKILLVNQDKNTAAVFCICIKYYSKDKNRDFGLASAK